MGTAPNEVDLMPEYMEGKIKRLTQYIKELDYIYHVLGREKIPNAEYDKLFQTLINLEKKYPEFKQEDTPTDKIGGEPRTGNVSEHGKIMYSMSNVFDINQFKVWLSTLGLRSSDELYGDLKMDGVALRLTYDKGKLFEAALRGNGTKGDVVTGHAMLIHNIPKVSENESRYEVYGEVVLLTSTFEEINKLRKAEGKAPYSNPRSAISGLMNTKVMPKLVNARFLAYGSDLPGFETHSDMMGALVGEYEFEIPEAVLGSVDNITALVDLYEKYNSGHADNVRWPFCDAPADGLVIKVDDKTLQERIGYTKKYPKFCKAWKFTDEAKTTRLDDIIYQVGRTGVVTPVALLDPVYVNGAKVSRCTLYNESKIEELQVMVGNIVEVVRSGSAVPKITRSISTTAKTKPFKPLQKCPECGKKLVTKSTKTKCCINDSCTGILKARLLHFVNRSGLDIKGFGIETLSKLVDEGHLKDVGDIFKLTGEELFSLFGEGETAKLMENIRLTKETMAFGPIMSAVGMPGMRTKDLDIIVNHIRDNNDIKSGNDFLKALLDIGLDMTKLMKIGITSASMESLFIYLKKDKGAELAKIFEYVKV